MLHAGAQTAPDAFVAAFDPDGALLYSTYVGEAGAETGDGIAVDAEGNISIAGFLAAGNAQYLSYGGYGYVTRLGNGAFSTVLGASTTATMLGVPGRGIAVDQEGNIIAVMIATASDLPVTPNAVQSNLIGDSDVYLVKFTP
ncbi:MAG: hypothetical protein HYZ57_11380 [Acidobacteria bacterium]|nr:hypothetical protein [Acidobacteriota bacterium]MBI3280431.1 hypothetical protein [Acidobacteriota bacterium]